MRVQAEDVHFLRGLDVDMDTLEAFQGYAGMRDRQRLLRWQLENRVTRDVDHILEHVTPHRFMKYMDGVKGGYGNMQYAVSEYRDYLDMCAKLEYDMSNGFVLYPKNLRQAHDEAARHVRAEADARMRREFQAAMEAVSGHLDFEAEGMKIVLPASPDDIVAEGQVLHHCVGGYVDRVARHECVIVFLRRCGDPDRPFYTIEIRGKQVIQVRGRDNGDPTPEVEKFMDKWERQVLQAA